MILTIFLGLGLCFVFHKLLRLLQNIHLAKATGLPYVLTPTLEIEIWGYILTPLFRRVYGDLYLLREGANGWPHWARFMIKDWPWEDKRRAHEEYGETFLVVAPGGIICYSADAKLSMDVMLRKDDFPKPADKYALLERYGPNVVSAEGKIWRFHVRITAPPFASNSGVNELVWTETLHQTALMAEAWAAAGVSQDLQLDVNALTLAVITRATIGKRVTWHDDHVPTGHELSLLNAMHTVAANIIPILLFPGWLMDLTPMRSINTGSTELERYMQEMIISEKEKIQQNSQYENAHSKGNLLTAVLKASAEEATRTNKETGSTKKTTFTDQEVIGNVFIYLLAGYETTANTIMYCLIMLALRPNLQAQLFAEISATHARATAEGRSSLSLGEDFRHLTLCFGYMYEILRLFPPVINITKMACTPQTVSTSSGSRHTLPAGCRVYLNVPGTQYAPHYWPEPWTIDPTRWTGVGTERFNGRFLAFSDGPRQCLGRKFAHAEIVGTIVTILRKYEARLPNGVNAANVEREVWRRSAGGMTLGPTRGAQMVELVKRKV